MIFYGLGNCQGMSGAFFPFWVPCHRDRHHSSPVQRDSTKLNKTGIPATSQFPILFNPRNLSFQVEGCRNRLCLCKDHRHEGCSSNVNISSGRLRAVFVSKFIPCETVLCTCALCQVLILSSVKIYGFQIWTWLPSAYGFWFSIPLIISLRCCKVNLFFPTADAFFGCRFWSKNGYFWRLDAFFHSFWWFLVLGVGKKFFEQPHVFTWEAERGSIKAGGSINESSIKAGATVIKMRSSK